MKKDRHRSQIENKAIREKINKVSQRKAIKLKVGSFEKTTTMISFQQVR